MDQEKLRAWVAQRLQRIPSADSFRLHPVAGEIDSLGDPLLELRVDDEVEGDDLEKEVARVVEDVVTTAEQDCAAYDNRRRLYKLVASSESETVGTFPFNLGVRAQPLQETGLLDAPTERGLLNQLMRHLESITQQSAQQSQVAMESLISENQHLRRQRDLLEDRRIEVFLKLEELESERHLRDLETRRFEKREERIDKVMGDIVTIWGPEVIKRFSLPAASKKSEPSNQSVEKLQGELRHVLAFDRELRDKILDSLDDEHKALYDSLVGFAEAPESAEAFRTRLQALVVAIPEAIKNEIMRAMATRDPARARKFLELLGIDADAPDEPDEADSAEEETKA